MKDSTHSFWSWMWRIIKHPSVITVTETSQLKVWITLLQMAAMLFLWDLYLKQSIAISWIYVMADFICVAYSSDKGREVGITKWKILLHSGTRTHNHWIAKPLPLPLGHEIWHTIDKLKLGFSCAIYIYMHSIKKAERLLCIQYWVI